MACCVEPRSLIPGDTDDPAVSTRNTDFGKSSYRRTERRCFRRSQPRSCRLFCRVPSASPRWLGSGDGFQRMPPTELFRLGNWFNSPGKLSLRVNRLGTTTELLLAAFEDAGVNVQPVPGLDANVTVDGVSQVHRFARL